MIAALIMAGGKGERFWPLSDSKKPKQFLKLFGDRSMLQMTCDRVSSLISFDRIFVVTVDDYADLIKEHLPELPEDNVIIEPVGRNTGACIVLSSLIIKKQLGDDVQLLVLPADHYIPDSAAFTDMVSSCNRFIMEKPDAVLTFGINPTRPDTNYGYIKYEKDCTDCNNTNIKKSIMFTEKPDVKKAKDFLNEGGFLWNAGIFLFSNERMLELAKELLPSIYNSLNEIIGLSDELFKKELVLRYPELLRISIDYGVLEKCDTVYVCINNFMWDDIGSWLSLERLIPHDGNGNLKIGNVSQLDSNNNIIIGTDKKVVLVGMNGILAIESNDIVYVGKKEDIERMKDIKEAIEEKTNAL